MSLTGLFPIDKWNFKSESVLNGLPAEEFEHLCANMTEQRYEKGDVLFREGAVPSGIFFIKKGKVKKYKVDHENKEHIVYVANTGELLGYHAILSEERYPDSAATIEESVIAFIPKEDFLETLEISKVLSQRLLKNLSHEFAVLTNSISVFAQRSVRERLAIMLIVLREKFKEETLEGEDITINISRSDLANMVGTAKENVVRFLKEFKLSGILHTHGRKIFVEDVKKLIEISNYGSK
ncbi:cAMP-binding domain of CRP or a regulatory subunit of cAMP-dependent protein kinases [Chitinophaga sp. CF118]|uniref:Crp/Fnr family transcriptional regulator n=1 Tax=Chitinophaga sp. CF118 TaxID=1884367 RepID=UPI0008EDC2C1|nr:Crp/Fnr family transcriptional regulator [Chitinophaga sp. CF118]SFE85825.1 cAMP-binding domain of CRP or a regulatory subunit of cAMP-dependent protein kinases [Chitinophaga sp. CF118]